MRGTSDQFCSWWPLIPYMSLHWTPLVTSPPSSPIWSQQWSIVLSTTILVIYKSAYNACSKPCPRTQTSFLSGSFSLWPSSFSPSPQMLHSIHTGCQPFPKCHAIAQLQTFLSSMMQFCTWSSNRSQGGWSEPLWPDLAMGGEEKKEQSWQSRGLQGRQKLLRGEQEQCHGQVGWCHPC